MKKKLEEIINYLLKEFTPDIIIIHTPNPLVEHYLNACHFEGKIIVYHHLDIYRQKILKHFDKNYCIK
mgnify:CR=1 FL=1